MGDNSSGSERYGDGCGNNGNGGRNNDSNGSDKECKFVMKQDSPF